MEESLNIFDKATRYILDFLDSSYSHDTIISAIHPYISFMAVALPTFLLIYHADNIKNIFISTIVLIITYITGYDAFLKYSQTIPNEAGNMLATHKFLALAVVLIYILVLVLKILNTASKKLSCEKFCSVALIIAVLLILIITYNGISMVFDYGVGVVVK